MRITDVKEQLSGKTGGVSLLETNFRIIVLPHCAKTICSYRVYSTLFHFARCPEGLTYTHYVKTFLSLWLPVGHCQWKERFGTSWTRTCSSICTWGPIKAGSQCSGRDRAGDVSLWHEGRSLAGSPGRPPVRSRSGGATLCLKQSLAESSYLTNTCYVSE